MRSEGSPAEIRRAGLVARRADVRRFLPIAAAAGLLIWASRAPGDVGPPTGGGTESRGLGGEQQPLTAKPSKPEKGGSAIPATLLVLGLIVAAAAGARAVARRGGMLGAMGPGGRAPAGVVEILARYPVGRGQSLVLIKIDRRVLVVSHTGGGLSTLCEITDAEDVASLLVKTRDEESASMDARFRGLLDRFSGSHRTAEGAGEEIPVVDLTLPGRGRVA